MTNRIFFWFLAVLLVLGRGEVRGQKTANWRMYRDEDGLQLSFTTLITVSPKGVVWAKHGFDAISMLDGYRIASIPVSGVGNFRIYQSRSDQIWSLYAEGLQEFKEGRWLRYPVPEIRAENRQQLPLIPAERDHVLFLLADRLMEFDASRRVATPLRRASETRLGRFLDMTSSRDGGAWIAGSLGLAKLPGPIRRLVPGTAWEEVSIPGDLGVQNLQRPFEDDAGGVTLVGELIRENRRVLVHFDGHSWITHPLPGGNIRQCWRDPDGSFWALWVDGLIRLGQGESEVMKKEGVLAGQYFDVATETNGVFWLATSEGLVRRAPFPWSPPDSLMALNSPVFALAEDEAGAIWLCAAERLARWRGGPKDFFDLPEEVDPNLDAVPVLAPLPEGRIAVCLNEHLYRFDPVTAVFEQIHRPETKAFRIISRLPDGRLCLVSAPAGTGPGRIELFDGSAFASPIELPEGWESGSVSVALQDRHGSFWIGGARGLAVRRDGPWRVFTAADGFLWDSVVALLEFDDGKVWCAARNLIAEFDGQKWTLVRSGFDRISALARSRETVWVATRGGLYRHWHGSWLINGVDEGLSSAAIQTVFVDRRGRIWAGTSRGVSQYFPEADVDPPRTFLATAEKQFKASSDGVIRIPYFGRDKWKYTLPERLLYSYRLDDGSWSAYTPRTVATFTNLAGGPHRFAVRAMDRNGNVEERDFPTIDFSVIVPWHRDPRLVAISILGLVIILLLGAVAVNRHLRLTRSYAEVERMVGERSRQLERAHQELLHSQKMKALGTLSAGVAHDFNSILSIIQGSVQIIEANLEDKDKIRTRVDRIKTVVNQGSGLVKAMLGFSRAGAKGAAEFSLNRAIEESIKLLDRLPEVARVRFEPGPDLPPVYGSRDLIQQILVNLVLNAVDALNEEGEIVVRSGHLSRVPGQLVLAPPPAEAYAYVTVQDSGCGIPPEVLPRIFEPFFTTKSFSTKRGTGLGLSMVYEFVKEMRYGLGVESKVGVGTTFTVLIPLAANSRSPAGTHSSGSAP